MTHGPDVMEQAKVEVERLGALRDLEIVGTVSEPQFDAVCSLAQTFFKVPTVLISFVEDDRQWFKARCGFGPEGTSRDVSFCDHVITSDDVMVVPDATQDARFSANPLVTNDPGIRFYAGAPLILKPGIRVGTVCVIDLVPRDFTSGDCRKLEEFAAIVVALIRLHEANVRQRQELVERAKDEAFARSQADELARQEVALREANRLLVLDVTERKLAEEKLHASKVFQERAGRIAGIGAWEFDLVARTVTFSDETRRIHEIEGHDDPDYDAAMKFYPPEARIAIKRAIDTSIRTGIPWDLELPFVTAEGRSIRVRMAGEVEVTDGKPVRLVGVFQDVSGRYLAERKIREQELHYRLLAENASDMIVRLDLAGTRLFVSPSSRDVIGYTPEELVGTRPRDSIHADDLSRFDEMQANLISGLQDHATVTNRLRHKNGDYVWVEATWRVVRDVEGQATEFVAAVRDVSARHETEQRLKTSESLYRTLADALPQIVWIVQATDRTAVYGNQRYHAYYGPMGKTRDERVSRNHPDDMERMEATWRLAAETGQTFDAEGRIRRHDGVYRWHKIIATPIMRDGVITEWLGTALDIDDIIVGRQKLKDTSDLLSVSQEAAGAGFFDLDLVTGRVVLSRESGAMHGLGDDDVIETDLAGWRACVDPDDADRVLGLVKAACDQGTTYSAEFRVVQKDQPIRWIHGTGRAQYDAAGRALRMIGLNFDITQRKTSEAKLIEAIAGAEAARSEAEKASAAKSDFLASMSHEIRTPLNSIIGYTDLLLEDGRHGMDDRHKLDLIKDSGSALLTIVNDILDFSKIEAGEVDLDANPFSLKALVDNTLAMVSGFTGAARLTIERDMAADLPAFVRGDAGRLRQILLNLLNNAVKFTADGTVKLTVLRETSRPGTCRMRFIVTDTGIGIPADRRERLFQRFSQVDGSIARRFGGTGLGLAISKSLVERMGGAIGVESTEGVGSSFWFSITLPIETALPDTIKAPRPIAHSANSARILLVEDIVINQDLARLILETGGHRVDTASNGEDAIAMVQGGHFDLVLMDVQMPGMDGITATRRIRVLDNPCRSIPIIAMTANVLPEQVALFKEAGMDDHVGKPFKRTELYATVARWARRGPDHARSDAIDLDRAVFDELRDMLGDAVCATLVRKFMAEVERRIGTLRVDTDQRRVAAHAHALISPAGSLGFTGLSNLCRDVEATAKTSDDLGPSIAALEAAAAMVLRKAATLL